MARGNAFYNRLIFPILAFFGWSRKKVETTLPETEDKPYTLPKKISNSSRGGSMFKKQKRIRIGYATPRNYKRKTYKGLYYINKSQRKWIKKYVTSTGEINGALRADIYNLQLLAGGK